MVCFLEIVDIRLPLADVEALGPGEQAIHGLASVVETWKNTIREKSKTYFTEEYFLSLQIHLIHSILHPSLVHQFNAGDKGIFFNQVISEQAIAVSSF